MEPRFYEVAYSPEVGHFITCRDGDSLSICPDVYVSRDAAQLVADIRNDFETMPEASIEDDAAWIATGC